jgi:AraC-like DNA-binding protein
MRMPDRTIAAGFAHGLVKLSASKGVGPDLLAKESHLDLSALGSQDSRMSIVDYLKLIRAAKRLCKDEAFALHFGESFELGDMSVVGLLGDARMTFDDSLSLLKRYSPLIADLKTVGAGRFEITRDKDGAWLRDQRRNPNDSIEITESAFARIACALRRFFPGKDVLKAIHLSYPAPEYRAEYQRIFRVPITFDSDRNALLLDTRATSYRLPVRSSEYVSRVLHDHAETLRTRLKSSNTMAGQVEQAIVELVGKRKPTIGAIARGLGVSRQSLYRRLKSEGVTFEKMLDDVRQSLALDYMKARKVSVSETAYLLGFSEPGAFSRAFKRWTGLSPRRYIASQIR